MNRPPAPVPVRGGRAMGDRRPQRVAALADTVAGMGLDGVLLTSAPNIRYLTGFSGSSALAFVTARRDVLLVTDFRYKTQAADEVGDLARLVVEGQSLWTGLWQHILSLPAVEVAGFESAHLVHRDFQRLLEAGARWQWRPTVDLVETLRERKDADELAHITAAAQVATRALARTLPQVRAGLTELEVAGLLEHALRAEGSETFPFATIVASGPRSALPHAATSAREMHRGDLLLLDFGASVSGYSRISPGRLSWGRPTTSSKKSTVSCARPTRRRQGAYGPVCGVGMPTRSRVTTLIAAATGTPSATVSATGWGWRCMRRLGCRGQPTRCWRLGRLLRSSPGSTDRGGVAYGSKTMSIWARAWRMC